MNNRVMITYYITFTDLNMFKTGYSIPTINVWVIILHYYYTYEFAYNSIAKRMNVPTAITLNRGYLTKTPITESYICLSEYILSCLYFK